MTTADSPIPSLPGYKSICAFDKVTHGKAGIADSAQNFAQQLNAILLHATEFLQACRHYPIVFVLDSNSKEWVPMAITSLENGKNDFINAQGHWQQKHYIPAYVRRYPFCAAQPEGSDNPLKRVVCVDPSGLDFKSQTPLINNEGCASEHWLTQQQLIEKMESERPNTLAFTRALANNKLLEPFAVSALPKDGPNTALTGIYRVNEQHLAQLKPETVSAWIDDQTLKLIYLHLMSLDNFRLLLKNGSQAKTAISG